MNFSPCTLIVNNNFLYTHLVKKKHNNFVLFLITYLVQKKESFIGKCHRISRSRHELFGKCPQGTATDRHAFDGRTTRRNSRCLLLAHEIPTVPFGERPKRLVVWTNLSNSCELWKPLVRYLLATDGNTKH